MITYHVVLPPVPPAMRRVTLNSYIYGTRSTLLRYTAQINILSSSSPTSILIRKQDQVSQDLVTMRSLLCLSVISCLSTLALSNPFPQDGLNTDNHVFCGKCTTTERNSRALFSVKDSHYCSALAITLDANETFTTCSIEDHSCGVCIFYS